MEREKKIGRWVWVWWDPWVRKRGGRRDEGRREAVGGKASTSSGAADNGYEEWHGWDERGMKEKIEGRRRERGRRGAYVGENSVF